MRLSTRWLADLVDIADKPPEDLADLLTRAGLEVEGAVEKVGPQFKGLVVAKVLKLKPHPNADKLRLATVTTGTGEQTVVCGAKNLEEGHFIPLAQVGATVYSPKQGAWFQLTPAEIRGVASEGMICSLDELALADLYPPPEQPGIWPINAYVSDADLGKPLTEALGLESDAVLHSAPTANRGDHMAYLGVARELAATLGKVVKTPKTLEAIPTNSNPTNWTLGSIDETLCPYYSATIIEGVEVKPSPDWLAQRLQASGIRPINNVVDITNYVMLEYGQPFHAFDADLLGPGKLGVRYATAGETVTTLDEIERKLTEESVVITKDEKPVALAGVMGGVTSGINEATKRVVLECAYFPGVSTRKSARTVGLRSESSARYERGIDPAGCHHALRRLLCLVGELAGGKVAGFEEAGRCEAQNREITLRLERLSHFVGQAYSSEVVSKTLSALGFELMKATEEALTVVVPSFREEDIHQEVDLIEEVLRIQGYDGVPATLPEQAVRPAVSKRQWAISQLHNCLQGLGLQEVSTASLVGPDFLADWGFPLDENFQVGLVNSHSQDHTRLRQTVLPGLLQVAQNNISQGRHSVWIYELGKTYFKRGKASHKHTGVKESLKLSLCLTGQPNSPSWRSFTTLDTLTLKGLLEAICFILGLPFGTEGLSLEQGSSEAFLHPGQQASVLWNNGQKTKPQNAKPIGWMGQLHPKLLKGRKWKSPAYCLELELEPLLKQLSQPLAGSLQETDSLSPYQPVERDLALLAPDSLAYEHLLQTLTRDKPQTLRSVRLFDEYRGANIPEGHRSLAIRFTLQSDETTLTDKEADSLMNQVRERLANELPIVSLR